MCNQVNISQEAYQILKLCEEKIDLQESANKLNSEISEIISRLSELSKSHTKILEDMAAIDSRIDFIARRLP